jgi:hypothetical protein
MGGCPVVPELTGCRAEMPGLSFTVMEDRMQIDKMMEWMRKKLSERNIQDVNAISIEHGIHIQYVPKIQRVMIIKSKFEIDDDLAAIIRNETGVIA